MDFKDWYCAEGIVDGLVGIAGGVANVAGREYGAIKRWSQSGAGSYGRDLKSSIKDRQLNHVALELAKLGYEHGMSDEEHLSPSQRLSDDFNYAMAMKLGGMEDQINGPVGEEIAKRFEAAKSRVRPMLVAALEKEALKSKEEEWHPQLRSRVQLVRMEREQFGMSVFRKLINGDTSLRRLMGLENAGGEEGKKHGEHLKQIISRLEDSMSDLINQKIPSSLPDQRKELAQDIVAAYNKHRPELTPNKAGVPDKKRKKEEPIEDPFNFSYDA